MFRPSLAQRSRCSIAFGSSFWLLFSSLAASSFAATLPAHEPLSILEISDEVNPHGLSAAELTQPGDICATLSRPGSGLELSRDPIQVDSQCVGPALDLLASDEPPDVVIYFAHRPASACGGELRDIDLVGAFRAHLGRGGGIVVFHHGAYEWAGKEEMLELLGVRASGIEWNTSVGQRVINVAPGHFVTQNGMDYPMEEEFELGSLVPPGRFGFFDNVPDERYPTYSFTVEAGETRTLLFASDSGGAHALGYALERSTWAGRVVGYQPGEFQPNALDALDGPNFQILANSILYSVKREGGTPAGGSGGAPSGGAPSGGSPSGGAPSGTGGVSRGGEASSDDASAAGQVGAGGVPVAVSGGATASGGVGESAAGGLLGGGSSPPAAGSSGSSTGRSGSGSGGCQWAWVPPSQLGAGWILLGAAGLCGQRSRKRGRPKSTP